MVVIPRDRPYSGPAILSSGFRPFFLGASLWAAIGIPLWLLAFADGAVLPSLLDPPIWHAHEMVFGFAAATVAGFLLTAIPNWTGRTPLRGLPLALLVALWAAGRVGVLFSGEIGAAAAAVADLLFPLAFLAVAAREILAATNWRNLPVLAALSLLLAGNLLVHLEALGVTATAALGNRVGIATLLLLISLVGGRIVPGFTRSWLRKNRPDAAPPAPPEGRFDRAALAITAVALALWTAVPTAPVTPWLALAAGAVLAVRLARWQGIRTVQEPLLLVLHVGYAWLASGLLLLGINDLCEVLPATSALHALTGGAVGTMTLAVMTRASLGHTGRPLTAGWGTITIYILVTIAAVLRVLSPLAGARFIPALWLAGIAWSGAFGLFAVLYGSALVRPSAVGSSAKPI